MEIKKIVVFDFDKTLSLQDTFNLFLYSFSNKSRSRDFQSRFLYALVILFRKIRFISNSYQKRLGLMLFLERDLKQLEYKTKRFVSSINLKPNIFSILQKKIESRNEVFICSGSPELYLKMLFPNIKIIGLEFSLENNFRIIKHPYKEQKLKILNRMGVFEIDELYTDSFSDRYLAKISKKTFIIEGSNVLPVNDYNGFLAHFNKRFFRFRK